MKLLSVLQIIEKSLEKNKGLSVDKIKGFLTLFCRYKVRELIYPRVVMRNLEIESVEAYRFLNSLEAQGIIEKNYEFYCHSCGKFCGDIYETINDIPDEIFCETCDNILDFEHNAVVIYRVLKDDRC